MLAEKNPRTTSYGLLKRGLDERLWKLKGAKRAGDALVLQGKTRNAALCIGHIHRYLVSFVAFLGTITRDTGE